MVGRDIISRPVCFWRLCVAVALLALPGCGTAPNKELLWDAWQRCEALEYATAMPLVRVYLLRHPRDPVAHYLLGKCYFNYPEPELTLAKGQFDMARFLFDADGNLSALEGVMSASEFQATLHCDTALALMRAVVEADKAGMPQHAALPVLKTAMDHARKGLYHNPDSSFLRELVFSLEIMVRELDKPHAPPEALPPDDHLLVSVAPTRPLPATRFM